MYFWFPQVFILNKTVERSFILIRVCVFVCVPQDVKKQNTTESRLFHFQSIYA